MTKLNEEVLFILEDIYFATVDEIPSEMFLMLKSSIFLNLVSIEHLEKLLSAEIVQIDHTSLGTTLIFRRKGGYYD